MRLFPLISAKAVIAVALLGAAAPTFAGSPLTLEEAIALSLDRQPGLDAYSRMADAAEEAAVAAAQLPDPELVVAVRNMPVTGDGAFSFDSAMMTMKSVGIQRRQVRGQKRSAASAALAAEGAVSLAEQDLMARQIQREVMTAWASVLEAQERARVLDTLIEKLRGWSAALEANVATGGAEAADVIALRAEIADIRADRAVTDDREAAARAALSRWIGEAAQYDLADAMPICRPDDREAAKNMLDRHPALGIAERRLAAADRGTDVARADRLPDWGWAAMYGQRNDRFGPLHPATDC